ncbi:MAG: hypothetical protein IT363_11105 [Methanoregulaceae archaeon]|nr:hypothetical protein [Methanoregulaceae archaeon]
MLEIVTSNASEGLPLAMTDPSCPTMNITIMSRLITAPVTLATMKRRMIMAVTFALLVVGISEAGHYELKPATESPAFKNPSGGTI